jgi:long-subunit fatty acid transport protein
MRRSPLACLFGAARAWTWKRVRAETDVSFPLNAVFGISYRPTPKWNFEFDAGYTDWSTLNTVTIKDTVKIHLKNHFGKHKVLERTQAVVSAAQRGFIQLEHTSFA